MSKTNSNIGLVYPPEHRKYFWENRKILLASLTFNHHLKKVTKALWKISN